MAGYQRKRRGLAAVFIAAIVIILGAGTCFAYPYIETVLSPKTQVLTALKEVGEDCQTQTEQILEEVTGLLTDQTEFTGEVTVTQAQLDETDYLKEMSLDRADFQIQTNAKKQSISGKVSADNSTQNTKREAAISADKHKLKEWLEASGYGYFYQDIDRVLNSVDSDTVKEYMDVVQKLSKHLQSALAVTLDQSVYEKNGKEELEIQGEEISTTAYTITITKEALLAGVEEFLNRVYSDSELSSYTTMFATFSGYSRYDLSRQAQELLAQMDGVDIRVYLNKDKKPVKLATEFDTDFSYITIEMQGKDHWNEQMGFRAATQRSVLTVTEETGDGKKNFDIEMRYHEENQEPYGYIALKLEKENRNIVCQEGKLMMKYQGHELSAAFTGKCTYQLYTGKS